MIVTSTEIIKRYKWVPCRAPSKRDIIIIEGVSYTNYIDISNYEWEIKKNLGTDPILKWEIVKRML